ncbi:MAG TPA: glycosyl hydrolase family 18 protein, partial [Opitutaceae bacterium]|nr:glycosyl hydrolase family 18 protein [Opitutaceae bacterium]
LQNGNSDLIWQNTVSGQIAIWLMNGTAYSSSVTLGSVTTDWKLVGTGKFGGTAQPDLIWQNKTNGQRAIWMMNGTTYVSVVSLGTVTTDWNLVGAADFLQNGNSDLIWQNTANGECALWMMNGTTETSTVNLGIVTSNWRLAGAGNFGGTMQPDLIWQDTSSNACAFWLMSGTSYVSSVTFTIGLPQAAKPTFSPAGGSYTSAQSVTISDATNYVTIRYTTDGSTPSETNGTIYTGAVTIGSTTTLEAIAYESGYVDSPVASATYTIGGGGLPPATPTGLAASATSSSAISVTWNASTGATSYDLTVDGSIVPGVTSPYISSGLAAASTHTYTVRADNSAGDSAFSSPVSATTTNQSGSLPGFTLTGYWQNFNNGAAVLRISDVPTTYSLIAVAFANAASTPGAVTFSLDPSLGFSQAQFIADIATAKARGQHVIISVGGQNGAITVNSTSSATAFANSINALIAQYGFEGVDIDLENGVNATYMAQALRAVKSGSIITMAPQTLDMQNTSTEYFKLALAIKDILTICNMQYYNSGSMLGYDGKVYSEGSVDFLTALATIQLENGLRPDQVGLGLPASTSGAGSGYVSPTVINQALNILANGASGGTFRPPHTYPTIRGAMTWSINWDASNGYNFANSVKAPTHGTPTIPPVPAGLTATAGGTSQITVTWNASSGATSYDLLVDGVVTTGASSPYVHTGLFASSTHTYAVRADNSAGNSAFSTSVSATTQSVPTVPAVPTGLSATADSSSQITVTWNASPGATSYDLQVDGTTVPGVTSPYTSSGLAAASTHTYAVRADNSAGDSALSASVSATTDSGTTSPVTTTGTINFHLLLGAGGSQDTLTLTGDNYTDLIMSNTIAGVMYGHLIEEYYPGIQFNKDYLYGSLFGQLLQENIATQYYVATSTLIDPSPNQQAVMGAGQGGPYQINNYAIDMVAGSYTPAGHSLINYIAVQKNIGYTMATASTQYAKATPPSFNNKYYGPMLCAYFHYNDLVALNVTGKGTGGWKTPWEPAYDSALANFVDLPNSFLDMILNAAYNQGYYGGLVANYSALGATATASTVASVDSYSSAWGNSSTYVQYPYQVHYYLDQIYDNPIPTTSATTIVTPANHVAFNIGNFGNVFSSVIQALAYSNGTSAAQYFTAGQAQAALNAALAQQGVSGSATLDFSNAADRARIYAVIDSALSSLESSVGMKFNATTNSQL